MNLYKARVLGFLEYRTPVVYHATSSVLQPLNNLQDRFLNKAGMTNLEALMVFNLAPLETRRDVAMLGLIHRSVLGKGPKQFGEFFKLSARRGSHLTRLEQKKREHSRQLQDWRSKTHLNVVRRSALGLTAVYNLLPPALVKLENVRDFQRGLQELVKERATAGCED